MFERNPTCLHYREIYFLLIYSLYALPPIGEERGEKSILCVRTCQSLITTTNTRCELKKITNARGLGLIPSQGTRELSRWGKR